MSVAQRACGASTARRVCPRFHPTAPANGQSAIDGDCRRMNGSEILFLGDGTFGIGDQQARLLLDGLPPLGVVQNDGGARLEQSQERLHDSWFRGTVAAEQADTQGEVLCEPPPRHDEGYGAGRVATDV